VRASIALGITGLALSLMLIVTSHMARATGPAPVVDPAPWQITGALEVPNPADYQATMRVSPSQYPMVLQNVRYYVVPLGVGPSIRIRPGETVAGEPIAFSTVTHTALMAVGTPTAASLAALPQPHPPQALSTMYAPSSSRMAPHVVCCGGGGGTGSVDGAYFESGWNDLTRVLTVGIVWDYMNFTYDGVVTSWSHWDETSAPIPDGDYFTDKSEGSYYYDGYVQGWTLVKEVAPFFYSTTIYWDPNELVAYGDGSVGEQLYSFVTGPDAGLVVGPWWILHD